MLDSVDPGRRGGVGRQRAMSGIRAYWVSITLAAWAVVLVLDPWPFESPVREAEGLPAWVTDPTPVRQPTLRPRYVAAGFEYRCSDCHMILPAPAEAADRLTQHTEIVLEHGINTRCFNCHHRTQRDCFVDDFGQPISWDQPQLLCAKCHGPVYRDWQHGAHGRVNGYWDTARGLQPRLRCIECHDPHRPPFGAMRPAPGPQTLRMGPIRESGQGDGPDPLRIHTFGRELKEH
jgi:hypothetical protein